jgi:hypothetical protein
MIGAKAGVVPYHDFGASKKKRKEKKLNLTTNERPNFRHFTRVAIPMSLSV